MTAGGRSLRWTKGAAAELTGERRAAALAVGGFAISFGVLAREEGLGRMAIVMSATTSAGSALYEEGPVVK